MGVLTGELHDSVREHKAGLLALADARAEFTRLFDMIVRLRCEDPKKGTRAAALAYVAAQIGRLGDAVLAAGLGVGEEADGSPAGFDDPCDPMEEDHLWMLREDLDELTAGPYPVPLPPGCRLLPKANFDPFEHGRLCNGRMIGD